MKAFLFLFLVSLQTFAQDIPVKKSLAGLLESAVTKSGIKINIVPDLMTPTSVNINMVNGIDVCNPNAKDMIIKLQNALLEHPDSYQIISIYGAYLRTSESNFKVLPEGSDELLKLLGECKNLYVRVK